MMILLGLVACATTTTQVSRKADPAFARKVVTYPTPVRAGTIVVDPGSHFLYLVQGDGQAIRYGIGVGGEGFGWSGVAMVHSKQEWPDWRPPAEMLERKPELIEHMTQLQSGIGMPGGPDNPLGARALYLWQGNKDTNVGLRGGAERTQTACQARSLSNRSPSMPQHAGAGSARGEGALRGDPKLRRCRCAAGLPLKSLSGQMSLGDKSSRKDWRSPPVGGH